MYWNLMWKSCGFVHLMWIWTTLDPYSTSLGQLILSGFVCHRHPAVHVSRLKPNETNLGHFEISFQYILAWELKCSVNWCFKSPWFVPYDANLGQNLRSLVQRYCWIISTGLTSAAPAVDESESRWTRTDVAAVSVVTWVWARGVALAALIHIWGNNVVMVSDCLQMGQIK